MPGQKKSHRTNRGPSASRRTKRNPLSRALLIIDNAPLQRAAWAEFHAAQKRHDKAAKDLHRHEQIDVPAYEAWLHRTFPVMITTLRELHQELFATSQRVQYVQAMASLSGRSPRKLWQEQKTADENPDLFDGDHNEERSSDEQSFESGAGGADFFGGGDRTSYGESFHDRREFPHPPENPTATKEAKAIYRRLVQHLHPDRGGEFTRVRERLWHEVQQAWAERDVDWLSRIEVEWETANEALSSTSPLSRLRRAIEELHAARRDTERKLREYRRSMMWRFTLSEAKRSALHRKVEGSFRHDIDYLERQLAYFKTVIAAWETPRGRSRRNRYATW